MRRSGGLTAARKWHPTEKKAFFYLLLSRILGFTFVLKKMEKGENAATRKYAQVMEQIPQAETISQEEEKHEQELLEMLDEEQFQYVGSMVLGLNDALVELTGTIAGMTFALMNIRLVALSGIITGVSATFSMAASNYLAPAGRGQRRRFPLQSVYRRSLSGDGGHSGAALPAFPHGNVSPGPFDHALQRHCDHSGL